MTVTLNTEPRRTPAVRVAREMPVLFHLRDVSRQQGFPAEGTSSPTAAASAQAATAEASSAAEPASTAASPAEQGAVSVQMRREQRNRNRKTETAQDWFGRHGKFIAISFVVVLLATIYFSRFYPRKSTPPLAEAQPHAHPGDAVHGESSIAVEMPPPAHAAQGPTADSPAGTIKEPASPAAESAAPNQLAENPAKEAGKQNDGLFPWASAEETRVAARPEAPPLVTATPAPEMAAPPTNEVPPALPTYPQAQPTYPNTGYRSQFQPAMAPPPAEQPAMAQPPAMPQPQPVGPQPVQPSATAGRSEPMYPTTNTARGIRYERTGSGLY